ncbi:MAG: hypothetical protein ABGX83_04495 [Nitrospira sp.]
MDVKFERKIKEFTEPLNNQYPRPWMTKLKNPCKADTFIVGKNQRNGYSVEAVGSHQRHLDALFNRNGQGCRKLYDEITSGKASPTRKNCDNFVGILEGVGVRRILETNVICYSTRMSADLWLKTHTGGGKRGEEIFRFLLETIKPKVLIVHGIGASNNLAPILGVDLGNVPCSIDDLRLNDCGGMLVVVIPSLAPPEFSKKWSRWAPAHMTKVAKAVARHLE